MTQTPDEQITKNEWLTTDVDDLMTHDHDDNLVDNEGVDKLTKSVTERERESVVLRATQTTSDCSRRATVQKLAWPCRTAKEGDSETNDHYTLVKKWTFT